MLPLFLVLCLRSTIAEGGPLSTVEALDSFRLETEDLEVSLVAAEPEVVDPVALAFDEAGHLYVVESRGYPHRGKGLPEKKLGEVARLEDEDGDGRFEKRTTFADGFFFPNGILRYGSGFFVTDAPDVWWLEDEDGDGKAEKKEVVLTGFFTNSSSEQLRVASPTIGPDGWIYLTSGLTGGKVISPKHPKRSPVEAKKSDWRFHPETYEVQAITGSGQVGQAFDHLGRRFVCDNRNPIRWVVFNREVLERNPNLLGGKSVMNLAEPGMSTPLYPLSPDTTAASFIPKLMHKPHAGSFTSSCGLCFYSGSALPKHRGSFFICEPAQNLVHCRFPVETGDTFTSRPSTKGREFLASPDQWFRPVFAANGPDGALYLCDMYRKYVDHPNYLPDKAAAKLDFDAGKKRGRIWKVTSRSKAKPTPLQAGDGVTRLIRRATGGEVNLDQLAKFAGLAGSNEWLRFAVLSTCTGKVSQLVEKLPSDVSPFFIEDAARVVAKEESVENLPQLVKKLLKGHRHWSGTQRFAFLLGFKDSIRKPYYEKFSPLARKAMVDPQESSVDRLYALRFLPKSKKNGNIFLKLALSSGDEDVRDASIRAVAETNDPDLGQKLLDSFSGMDVSGRDMVVDALTRRHVFHSGLLESLESGRLPLYAIPLQFRGRFKGNPAVKERAAKLFESVDKSNRMQVYDSYKDVLSLPSKPDAGEPVFRRVCASCHRMGEVGHAVGPDLSGLRNQPADALLLHTLAPNREVYSDYLLYNAETKAGDLFAGILSEQTDNSVTLVLPLGHRQVVSRSDLKSLKTANVSLMPDGLEKAMSRQEMADLIAFLKQ